MIQGKIVWIEEGESSDDPKIREAAYDAHIVVMNGRYIKNRLGPIAPLKKEEEQLKQRLHVQLIAGCLAGPTLDMEDGRGPVSPIDRIDTIAEVCADGVDKILKIWRERDFDTRDA